MMAKNKANGAIQKWGERINWEKRVKAVCKPCWEIKYCPYGPLVESFPLKRDRDERSCRIFGHDCPVFSVAEPFTETKELRNISREIPRVTKFRVLKRENQICSICGKSVKDEDVEFDHIIPRIKGGSSDESNVRLLCRECNRKKGRKFEDEYLVESLREHVLKPMGIEVLRYLTAVVTVAHSIFKEKNRYPAASDIYRYFGKRKANPAIEFAAGLIEDMDALLNAKKPPQIKQNVFRALKYRWGFSDREFHKLQESAEIFKITSDDLLSAELLFINILGWQVQLTETAKKKWLLS